MRRRLVSLGAALLLLTAVGCQTVAPALSSLLLAFGQDLLATTAVNYTPRYAMEVENLLAVLATHATGMQFESQLAKSGYQPPPAGYTLPPGGQQYPPPYATPGYGTPVYGTPGYGTPAFGQTSSGTDPYAAVPAQPSASNPYAASAPAGPGYQDPYSTTGASTPQDPYAPASSPTPGYQDPYAASGQQTAGTQNPYDTASGYGYGQATYGGGYTPPASGAYQDPYAVRPGGFQTRSIESSPISLGVALLAQRAGTTTLEAIEDGARLRDGRGDPSRGDLLRVHFQSNCRCWVYVVGIDGTGYVAQIFPDPAEPQGNPVTPGINYLMPGGDQWWGLDEQRGIEQVYFVAAREQRPDIEDAIRRLAAQPRSVAPGDYQPVSEPAIVPATRGLVKVAAPAPVQVPVSAATQAVVTPAIFTNTDAATDLVISRWFHHE